MDSMFQVGQFHGGQRTRDELCRRGHGDGQGIMDGTGAADEENLITADNELEDPKMGCGGLWRVR